MLNENSVHSIIFVVILTFWGFLFSYSLNGAVTSMQEDQGDRQRLRQSKMMSSEIYLLVSKIYALILNISKVYALIS